MTITSRLFPLFALLTLVGCDSDSTDGADALADTVQGDASDTRADSSLAADTDSAPETTPTSSCYGTPQSCDYWSSLELLCNDRLGCYFDKNGCSGIPSTCESLTVATCFRQKGCETRDGGCKGVAQLCHEYTDSFSCGVSFGCTWEDSKCLGSPVSCNSFNEQVPCILHTGCQWRAE